MKQNHFRENFFFYAKIGFLLVVLAITVLKMESEETTISIYLLFSALLFACEVCSEIIPIKKIYFGMIEVGLLLIMNQVGFIEAVYFGPIVLLDFIVWLRFPVYLCLLICVIPLVFGNRITGLDVSFLWIEGMFAGLLYYQEYAIVKQYQKNIKENQEQESRLKQDMEYEKQLHEDQMKQSRLKFENQVLTEKANISQALHDKLGHSINGSLYQLEACKVILEKEPEESKKILQAVIDALRSSMDEIRFILRREKPSRKQMTLLSLHSLCEECKEKYSIDATLKMSGEEKTVPENLWEIILDNAYEAVSNALKYAKCTKISIEIYILNEVVRCTIGDNGVGCVELKDGMGLQGMKRRVRSVNGYLDVKYDQGFEINMILPLHQKQGGML